MDTRLLNRAAVKLLGQSAADTAAGAALMAQRKRLRGADVCHTAEELAWSRAAIASGERHPSFVWSCTPAEYEAERARYADLAADVERRRLAQVHAEVRRCNRNGGLLDEEIIAGVTAGAGRFRAVLRDGELVRVPVRAASSNRAGAARGRTRAAARSRRSARPGARPLGRRAAAAAARGGGGGGGDGPDGEPPVPHRVCTAGVVINLRHPAVDRASDDGMIMGEAGAAPAGVRR
jgi:hypothetical protein